MGKPPTDYQIDDLVYQLYHITDKERVATPKGRVWLPRHVAGQGHALSPPAWHTWGLAFYKED